MTGPFRISIAASFTAEPLEPVLKFWGDRLGMDFEVRFAPFQQVVQTLLDPAGEFASNRQGVNVAIVRAADLGDRAVENARQLVNALQAGAPVILVLCPSLNANAQAEEILRTAQPLEAELVDDVFDTTLEALGGIPYTERYFASLGTAIARRIASLALVPYKAIAVDCDNTLWEGICGEEEVRLDPERRALHEFLLRQREAGMLLVLVTKNNPADVAETFARHPEFPLRPEHFTAARVNWDPKPGNLSSLSRELGLGIDSFIFIDDSARECAEMREEQPQVLTLQLPEKIGNFLTRVWAFDHPAITAEDRKRAESYAQAREFGHAFQSAHSLEEFMASLDLHLTIEPPREDQLPRVAQLLKRTNQFRFTDIREWQECLAVTVRDRFGNYGLVGAMLFHRTDGLMLDNFLLSCRALGRGVEHRMMAHLAGLGLPFIEVAFTPTDRNEPARQFLRSMGSSLRFAAAELANLRWKPPAAAPLEHAAVTTQQHRFLPFEEIARDLWNADQILAAMQSQHLVGADSFSETERELASIWADLLKVPRVGLDDRFFELGGHSLLAVLLIGRVRVRMQVELRVDDVYSGDMTLRGLAAKIDALRSGGVDAAEYEAMLAEIASLSDEDVKALLGQQ